MRGAFPIARIAGIDVKIHVTFFLLLAWIGFVYHRSGGVRLGAPSRQGGDDGGIGT